MNFYTYIFIGILLVVSIPIFYNYYCKIKVFKNLNDIFGELPIDFLEDFDMEFVKEYYTIRKSNEDFNESIDELTWNDLEMDTVFKRINYTKTTLGESYLYYKLREIKYNKQEWDELEKLIKLFSNDENLRNEVYILLQNVGKLNNLNLINFIYNPKFTKIKGYYKYPTLLIGFLSSIVISFFFKNVGILLILIFIGVNIFSYYSEKLFLEDKFNVITYLMNNINLCKKLSKIKNKEFKFFNDNINEALNNFSDLNKVRAYCSSFEKRGHSFNDFEVIFDYIKMIFMIDIIAYQNSIKILEKNKEELYEIYDIVSKIDFALSISFYRKSIKEYSIPEFTESEDIELENLYHPLVKNPIKNSIIIKNNIIFTGSNASGKSTFIKSIALNCILAQSLNTALCSKYKCKISKVVTSMSIRDNVILGESYFIAEIKSLKRLFDSLNGEIRVLAFIDEILKGTNTIERISAAAAILKYAKNTKARLFVATHDIELTEIISDYENFHFSEIITDDEVNFDYKLKLGPSKTRNALKLLNTFDFENEIICLANSIYNDFIKNEKWNKV
ncbi:DNA mismatch repair protein MutS [Clostridium perfringens]|uniref:MutS-related protein n=1 Tax=Clostridium perfringens TaxID=1502 RepID=UPI00115C3168|nr:DNA mismatch repair protein MutS [Clostridium perfringens]ELP5179432.1 DNA mismatch repair protein MutS [Clostridium perfringens]ELP5182458.1 DNA mismatch repair protein MutS [Clostridium perfringens]ELP5185053.1 DNA mismatch repair protein MutS [Clostridium perfringens]ELP5188403.1 DNA mismatch repair protein MutS [Clostridium perfringens]MDM0675597.1 DNA mismatch repair protein MutS [Clostridium perfringens]